MPRNGFAHFIEEVHWPESRHWTKQRHARAIQRWFKVWLSSPSQVSVGRRDAARRLVYNARRLRHRDTRNCGCEGVRIRWDFEGAWEAIVLEGDKCGQKRRSCVAKLGEVKWNKMNGSAKFFITWGDITQEQKKAATKEWLEICMHTFLS